MIALGHVIIKVKLKVMATSDSMTFSDTHKLEVEINVWIEIFDDNWI